MTKYIERNVLEDRIVSEKDAHDIDNPYWVGYHNGLSMAHAITLSMPAADVEVVKHGRWEECDWVEYDGHGECVHYPHEGCVCTNCRNAFKKEFVRNPRVNVCPSCGAKMDLGG